MSAGKTIKFSGLGQTAALLDPKNWVGGVVPGIDNSALITINVGGPVAGTFSVNNLMLLGTETITFTGTLDTAGVGACQGLMICEGADAIFAPGAVLNDGNVLIVGDDAAGTLIAQGIGAAHSVLNTVDAKIGVADDGVGSVTINDGVWNNSGHAVIGNAGMGTLAVINGGSVMFGGSVEMAASAGSHGILTIASGGSVVVGGALEVGGGSNASVSVGAGSGLTVDHSLSVGAEGSVAIAGGTITASATQGQISIAAGGLIAGHGVLAAPDGVPIAVGGTILASGGTLEVDGNINGAGTLQIAANSVAKITGESLKLASIAFIGASGALVLASGADVTGAISGFTFGDTIATTNVDAASFNAVTGMLTLSEHGVKMESLHLLGSYTGDTFALQQGGAGALVTLHH